MKKKLASCAFLCAFFSLFSMSWELEFRYDRWGDISESFYTQGSDSAANGKIYAAGESPQDISTVFRNYDATPDCLTIVCKTISGAAENPGRTSEDERVVVSVWRNDRTFSFYGINRAKIGGRSQISIDVVAEDLIYALRDPGPWAIMVQSDHWYFCSTIDGNLPTFLD